MNHLYIIIAIVSAFSMSCGDTAPSGSFRDQIDQAKAELKDTELRVSTYAMDSSNHWKVVSQITKISKDGVKSASIDCSLDQNNQLVKGIEFTIKQAADFQGQAITTDLPDSLSVCYLLKNTSGSSMIIRINCNSQGNHEVEELDSLNTKNWLAIKEAIVNKKR